MELNGFWEFSFLKDATVAGFSPEMAAYEELAAVPGCFDSTMIHRYRRGLGVYRRNVRCGGAVELTLEAIGLFGKVWFDGREIGECPVPFTRETFRFDAGPAGDHELVIAVQNVFDASVDSPFREYYDFYGFGGIYRPITLRELPEIWLDHTQILPLDPASGRVAVSVELAGAVRPEEPLTLRFDDNTPVEVTARNGSFHGEMTVPSPRLWTPDTPHLHTLQLAARTDAKSVTFGLRTIEAKAGRLLLNGAPLKWIGVNRHDSHPEFGYAMPESLVLNDLLAIKQQGFNGIRGSHYPQSETVLTLCDRIGLLVWDESLGWQNQVASLVSPGFQQMTLRQTGEMVRHAINHPSVILWGFLNETYTDREGPRPLLENLVDLVHRLDPSRPVTFASMVQDRDIHLDLPDVIAFNVYPGWYPPTGAAPMLQEEFDPSQIEECFARLERFTSRPEYRDKPVIISEIGAEALPGDHSGLRWSEDYQAQLIGEVLRRTLASERFCGVLLWMFADSRTYSNGKGQERARGFNNKGLVDEYRRPKLAWMEAGRRLKENQ